jgi:hypothetical protein
LMEVASYLWPRPFAAGVSLSPMSSASPQKLHAALAPASGKIASERRPESAGTQTTRKIQITFWEGGRAEVLDTCLAHWPQPLEESSSSWDSKGVSSLHPVLFREIRANAAERLSFPAEGDYSGPCWPLLPWRRQEKRSKFGPDEVPFRRNPEQQNFTETR